jgi:uncharacterized protein YlxW (UPF0749 family)
VALARPWPLGDRRVRPLRVGSWLVLVMVGLLAVVTARSSTDSRPAATSHNRLADLVSAQQQQIEDATREQRRLQAEVNDLTAAQAERNAAVAQVQKQGAALMGPAGLLPARGAAVTVSLDDAPKGASVAAGYAAPAPDDLVVHQQDVQAVVNALWSGGAEAMTIMGQRVISTTAVRCVGNTLLLQGRVYSPPFIVSAIGDPDRLQKAVQAAPGVKLFQQYVQAYGLRFKTSTAADAKFPGYDGAISLAHAQPLNTPSQGAGS